MERSGEQKNILLVIDPQNDFTNPEGGKLYVKGAEIAIQNLRKWILQHKESIARIILTQDSHMSYHIGHSKFWKESPRPGTEITYEDVLESRYNPVIPLSEYGEDICEEILDYFKTLKEKGLTHKIWPEHCIKGSRGWSISEELIETVNTWSLDNRGLMYDIVEKGTYPYKEMYSAISYADGTVDDDVHDFLVDTFCRNTGKIYVAGFAKDYCVAETVRDLIKMPVTEGRLVFLEDCMATIDKNNPSLSVYNEAINNYGAERIQLS